MVQNIICKAPLHSQTSLNMPSIFRSVLVLNLVSILSIINSKLCLNMDVRLKLDALILKVPVMSDMDNLVPGKGEKRRNL